MHMAKYDKTCDLHPTAALWRIAGGWTCLFVGGFGLALPIIPGIPLLIIGLAALSPNYLWARSGLRWMRERFERRTEDLPPLTYMPSVNRRVSGENGICASLARSIPIATRIKEKSNESQKLVIRCT